MEKKKKNKITKFNKQYKKKIINACKFMLKSCKKGPINDTIVNKIFKMFRDWIETKFREVKGIF